MECNGLLVTKTITIIIAELLNAQKSKLFYIPCVYKSAQQWFKRYMCLGKSLTFNLTQVMYNLSCHLNSFVSYRPIIMFTILGKQSNH